MFIQPNGQTSVSFAEGHKAVGNWNNVGFGTTSSFASIDVTLNRFDSVGANALLSDASTVIFDNSFVATPNIQTKDVVKFSNHRENISILKQGTKMSIYKQPLPQVGDTIQLNTTGCQAAANLTYQFVVKCIGNLGNQIHAELYDKYLNNFTTLSNSQNTLVNFSIDANNSASKAADRFAIVFKAGNPLSVSSIQLQGHKNEANKQVVLNWKVTNQKNVVSYSILRKATNASEFTEIGRVNATSQEAYQFTDKDNLSANSYLYQVKVNNTDGSKQLSNVIQISIVGNENEHLLVTPNPVITKTVVVKPSQVSLGKYDLKIMNMLGQVVYIQTINYVGNTIEINLPNSILAGNYRLVLESKLNTYNTNFMVK